MSCCLACSLPLHAEFSGIELVVKVCAALFLVSVLTGAKVSSASTQGETPLHTAVQWGHWSVARLLLAHTPAATTTAAAAHGTYVLPAY